MKTMLEVYVNDLEGGFDNDAKAVLGRRWITQWITQKHH